MVKAQARDLEAVLPTRSWHLDGQSKHTASWVALPCARSCQSALRAKDLTAQANDGVSSSSSDSGAVAALARHPSACGHVNGASGGDSIRSYLAHGALAYALRASVREGLLRGDEGDLKHGPRARRVA